VRAGERDAHAVAEHFAAGGDRASAVEWFRRAARQALEANEYDLAVERAERAVSCGAAGETLGSVRALEVEAHRWKARFGDVLRCADAARAELARGSSEWFLVTRSAVRAAVAVGKKELALEMVAELEATTSVSDGEDRARALLSTATHCILMGEHAWARRIEAAVGDVGDDLTRALRASLHARYALFAGDPAGALREFQTSRELAERGGDARTACVDLMNIGFCYALLGADDLAESTLDAARRRAERLGMRAIQSGALQNVGPVLARASRFDEARAAVLESIRILGPSVDRRQEAGSRTYLAEILLAAGDLDAAREEAERAAEMSAEERLMRPYSLAVLARVRLARGDVASARTAATAALGGVDDVNEGESTIRLAYAEALHAAGELEEARARIAAARQRLVERAAKISDEKLRDAFLRLPLHVRTFALADEW
jgi:tetratricopeptide (TPR) repeat protein